MAPPVRMVCGDCLQSVELDIDDPSGVPSVCPSCGGTIDTLLSQIEETSRFTAGPLPLDLYSEMKTHGVGAEAGGAGSPGTFGRFQIREPLGFGASGQVYRAFDPLLERDVALKVLKQFDPGTDERASRRFFREARAAARLHHPNIVPIYNAGHDAGRCWIAYRFVRGWTLSRYRDHRELGRTAAVRIIRDLADALDHAHAQGILHRDLKPSNVLIDEQGRPYLTDFGLARRADLDSDLTHEGVILGTPAYMSPEQASGRSDLADERSDVYSLGVIFYELLCGQRPINQPTVASAWLLKPHGAPPPPRTIDRTIPTALERICLKALAFDPGRRYSRTRTMADELDRWLARCPAVAGRSRPLVGIAAGLAAAALAVAVLRGARALVEPPRGVPAPSRAAAPPPPPAGAPASPPPPSPPTRRAIPDAAKVPLVGNRKTQTYHRAQCPTLHSTALVNRVKCASVAEALGLGFQPCVICHPPTSDPE